MAGFFIILAKNLLSDPCSPEPRLILVFSVQLLLVVIRDSALLEQVSSRKLLKVGIRLSGKIILLNGASSSGKSTLARGLQATLEEPFWHFSIDHLIAANVLPKARIDGGEFPWRELRPHFFEGFHRCLPALAAAGNNLIVEHIVETEAWMQRLLYLLSQLDVFFVGVRYTCEGIVLTLHTIDGSTGMPPVFRYNKK